MKPLVYWCRWNSATLRLHGRSATEVWGELAFGGETKPFRFNLESWELAIGASETFQAIRLDEMGVAISDAESS